MLLIVIPEILFWIIIGLIVITVFFSSKGILSPKFTLLLFAFFGGGIFLTFFLSVSKAEQQVIKKPMMLVDDIPQNDTIEKEEALEVEQEKKIGKKIKPKNQNKKFKDGKNDVIVIDDTSVIENLIPQKYEVLDSKFKVYRMKGSWELGKPFIKYFAEKTGWRKTKKGNYEIEVSHNGKFTQRHSENERLYVYSGGEIEIKINGTPCCCNTVLSIPEDLSDGKLVKAQAKLAQMISDLIFKNKERVLFEIQKCL